MSAPTPSSPEEYKDVTFTEDDERGGVDADADDDDDEPSSWKRLGMGKLFGKKKTMRRKKYTKSGSASAAADAELDIDSSINTDVLKETRQRRPPRQRAKVAMYPPKNVGESSGSDSRGREPMDSAMEAALPQRRQMPRKHHSNPRRPDPPTGKKSQAHNRRGNRKGSGDGYENSGHETSDFFHTEDERSDFYAVTEDDRDNDDDEEEEDVDDDDCGDEVMNSLGAATKKLSLGSDESNTGTEGNGSQKDEEKQGEKPASDEKPKQSQSNPQQQHTATPSSQTKSPKKQRRRRTPKSKKGPQTVAEDPPPSTQKEEEVDCHTPHQQPQQLQTPEKEEQKPPQEKQPVIAEKEESSPQEDQSKCPSSMTRMPTKEGGEGKSPKGKKKRSNRNRRSPKKEPQIVQQDDEQPSSMQEEEELDCHTPMKTTLKQQQGQQTPKKPRQQKSPNEKQPMIDEEKEVDPHEDKDDYPLGMMCFPTNEEDGKQEPGSQKGKKKHVPPKRTLEEELSYLKRISSTRYQVQLGFVPNMIVPAEIIVNNDLQTLLVQELQDSCCGPKSQAGGAFIPALRQAANVAALPGIVRASLAMPDVHSGYGFCIGNVAAFDMGDPSAVISPGGVGFDINCGVRLIRTNLTEDDVDVSVREELAEALFRNIPVGVGAGGDIPCSMAELDKLLGEGIDWAIEKGFAWPEDRDHCEENGRMETADPKCVSHRAKKRGLKQLGTLGAGNHYAEIQVVDEIYHPEAAQTMGIGKVGQVCVMIHTGSRGLGHQVATDALTVMEKAMARDSIDLNDRQLSCARIHSREGKEYLAAMSSAANFAWVNRSCITFLTRKAFSEVFDRKPEDMDMHLVYDVCHNIAKVEKHDVDGVEKTLLVHRKGSTRAFPPDHPNIPKDYQSIGQPVLIGGTMGTCSYVLVGTEKGMTQTFGSTCHGAGRALSRNQSRKKLDHNQVLEQLHKNGISIRVASPKLVTEEAPESYKNVCDVIDTCQDAGISRKVVKLRPIAVIKG